jgi:hypothetical protein
MSDEITVPLTRSCALAPKPALASARLVSL